MRIGGGVVARFSQVTFKLFQLAAGVTTRHIILGEGAMVLPRIVGESF